MIHYNYAANFMSRHCTGVCRPTLTAIVPKSGSIVSGTHNIRLYCEAFEGSDPIQTVWLQQTAKDREEDRNPRSIPFSNENFDRTGEIIFTSGVNISLYTNLTILELTEEMDRDIIFCAANNRLLANFTLITYSKHCNMYQKKAIDYTTLYNYVTLTMCDHQGRIIDSFLQL